VVERRVKDEEMKGEEEVKGNGQSNNNPERMLG
jgi:hypothetical protein